MAPATDPFRTLLRGCRGISARPAKLAEASAPATGVDADVLDFFGDAVHADAPVESGVGSVVGHAALERALAAMGVVSLTEVQKRALPLMFGRVCDVVAVAPTGSGKTLAYALPCVRGVLEGWGVADAAMDGGRPVRAVVVVPTRELAVQVGAVFGRVVEEAGVGGDVRVRVVCSKAAVAALGSGAVADIIVGTPMRLLAAVQKGVLELGRVKSVVLDEADQLFDDGFVSQVDDVLAACGASVSGGARVHMFSATLPGRTELLARTVLKNPVKVVVGAGGYGGSAAVEGVAKLISQRFLFVGGRGEQGKVLAVRSLLKEGLKPPVLLFVQSKDRAAELYRELIYDGVNVDAIHADRSQAARASAITRFRSGKLWLLIATDVLARGLDFLCVNTVINYDLPASATAYIHRIGRTGRNGRAGNAVTLFTEEDAAHLPAVLKIARASGAEVPEWATKLRAPGRTDVARRLETRPPKRKRVGGPNAAVLHKRHRSATVPGTRNESRSQGETESVEKRDKPDDENEKRAIERQSLDADGGSGRGKKRRKRPRKKGKLGTDAGARGVVQLDDDGDRSGGD